MKEKNLSEKKKHGAGYYVALVVMLVGTLTVLVPIYWMVVSSLKSQTELMQTPPTFWPQKMEFSNYARVFEQMPFGRYYFNSVVTALLNTVMGVFTSALSGYVFAKYQFKGRELLFWLLMACMMIPYDTLMIPLYRIMVGFGWTNTYLVLTVPYFVNIFGMFLMRQFMQDIPTDYIEAAEIDGCSQYRTFFSVIFPMVRPAAAALCIFLFMASYNSFLWPLISVNSRDLFTLPVGMSALNSDRGSQMDLMMACATMVVAPVCVIFALAQKNFVAGLTMGGVKG